jgi:hypothetical protein
MTLEEIRHKIDTDPDFVHAKRFDNSLKILLEKYPEGAPAKVVAQALLLTEEEVEDLYQKAVVKLRRVMKVEV